MSLVGVEGGEGNEMVNSLALCLPFLSADGAS